jgi:drug/metabolite transporter (DMT)-like permease
VSTHVAAGFACALGAAALYGAAPVAQAVAARREPARSERFRHLIGRLLRSPLWLIGLVCEVAGFVIEAVAFGIAPAALVAPVIACDTLVFVIAASIIFRGRPSRAGLLGAGAITGGVVLLAVAFAKHPELGNPASTTTQLVFIAAAVAVPGIAFLLGRPALRADRLTLAATAFATASGGCYGLATMGTRQVGRTFRWSDPLRLFTTPTPYLLIVGSVLAVAMLQRALQSSTILAFPLTSAVSAVLPVILGTSLLGDQAPAGARRILFALALVLMATGVALLGRHRAAVPER